MFHYSHPLVPCSSRWAFKIRWTHARTHARTLQALVYDIHYSFLQMKVLESDARVSHTHTKNQLLEICIMISLMLKFYDWIQNIVNAILVSTTTKFCHTLLLYAYLLHRRRRNFKKRKKLSEKPHLYFVQSVIVSQI